MIQHPPEKNPGARALLAAASLVVIVYGLRFAAPILQLFFLALFLAVVGMPLMFQLRRRRIPASVAIGVTVLLELGVLGFIVRLAVQSARRFQAQIPLYQGRFDAWVISSREWIQNQPLLNRLAGDDFDWATIDLDAISGWVTQSALGDSALGLVGGTVQWVATIFVGTFLVTVLMIFIMAETTVFPAKFRSAFGGDGIGNQKTAKVVDEVQGYLLIKTMVSLATGVTVGLATWALGVDLPVLMGLIAFLLNFIPNIGSAIASIPAVILTFLELGLGRSILVALVYLAINVLFGNFLEPNLMGRRLGLSTLVVILSLIFWTWLWGVVGALLAVPLTMVVKIMLENTEDLRWIAILLDKAPPKGAMATPVPELPEQV